MTATPPPEITLRRPDDWHVHLRDGAVLEAVVGGTAMHFARALVMPNLIPPVVTTKDILAYRGRIMAALAKACPDTGEGGFTPLMTAYLTEATDPADIVAGHGDGVITAVKLYPAGATTNSQSGVCDVQKVMPVLEGMATAGIPLCVHGEVVDDAVDIFDREKVFIEKVLDPLRRALPELRIIMEHITTADAVEYVSAAEQNLAATITTHHLMITRNHILAGSIRPHYYCLPVAKRESHRRALVAAATSGDKRFFLGTDSAPHADSAKLAPCGCAGIYTAPVTLSCLAHVFAAENAMDKFQAFTSEYGAAYYGLPLNEGTIKLIRGEAAATSPATITAGDETITLFNPGIDLCWRVDLQSDEQPGG